MSGREYVGTAVITNLSVIVPKQYPWSNVKPEVCLYYTFLAIRFDRSELKGSLTGSELECVINSKYYASDDLAYILLMHLTRFTGPLANGRLS